jgi:hypothetical protein
MSIAMDQLDRRTFLWTVPAAFGAVAASGGCRQGPEPERTPPGGARATVPAPTAPAG